MDLLLEQMLMASFWLSKEYPAYFKEAGISASQFIAIIAETSKQGIYSDKGLDAIKEGNLRIREMTNQQLKP